MSNFTLLIDIDNTIADFELQFLKKWKEKYPLRKACPCEERTSFYLHKDYSDYEQQDVDGIYHEKGFFKDIPLIPGAKEALKEMETEIAKGSMNVWLLTSPVASEWCAKEKIFWIRNNLGTNWVPRTIMAKDKTMVRGNLLIDDKVPIKGSYKADWQQVIFHRPYNSGNNSVMSKHDAERMTTTYYFGGKGFYSENVDVFKIFYLVDWGSWKELISTIKKHDY